MWQRHRTNRTMGDLIEVLGLKRCQLNQHAEYKIPNVIMEARIPFPVRLLGNQTESKRKSKKFNKIMK